MGSEPSPTGKDGSPVERLLESHLDDVTRYVRRNIGPTLRAKESVSDVVQSVCREVLDRKDHLEFHSTAAFRAYLYRSALRKVIDRRRYYLAGKRDVDREVTLLPAQASSPRCPDEMAEALDRFEAAFTRLSAAHQDVITQRRIVGLNTNEAARQLGVSAGEVRRRLAQALARLAVLMEDRD